MNEGRSLFPLDISLCLYTFSSRECRVKCVVNNVSVFIVTDYCDGHSGDLYQKGGFRVCEYMHGRTNYS